MRFLPELGKLDADLREVFLEKLRVRWTHTSTALEGNTLTEGETFGVLRYGLTVSGKPLADHNEVLGHQRALDMVYRWLESAHEITEEDLFNLHRAVQLSVEVDYLKPVGAWKREPNSTLAKQGGKTVVNDTYASPESVPALMEVWLRKFQSIRRDAAVPALEAYVWSHATFVRIHPFADGNGRMARLRANIPVIEKGELPVLIPAAERLAYVEALATWQLSSGPLKTGGSLEGLEDRLSDFSVLCKRAADVSAELLAEVLAAQRARA